MTDFTGFHETQSVVQFCVEEENKTTMFGDILAAGCR